MGNQQINSSSIESFVLSINEDEVQNIEESQLMSSLFNLYKIFQKNPNAYIDFKKSEEKQIVNANLVLNKEGESEGSSSSKITKAKKYQSILLNLLMKKFDNEIIYLLLFKLISYIVNEKEFLNAFMKNGLEQLCVLILGIEKKLSKIVFIEGCELLNKLMCIFHTKPSLLEKQLSTLFKIFSIPKKLNEKEYMSDYNMNLKLCQLMKNCIILLVTIQEILKTLKFAIQKDFTDFIKNIINDYASSSLLVNLINAIEIEKINNIVNQINLINSKTMLEDTISNFSNTPTPKEAEKKEQSINELSCMIKAEIEKDNLELMKMNTNTQNSFPIIVISIFKMLNKISFVFTEKIIKPEVEIEKLITFILNNESNITQNYSSSDIYKQYYMILVQEILSFLTSFFISFCLNNNQAQDDSISVLYVTDKSFEKKISILFNIFQNSLNEEIKYLISTLFCAIVINRQVWANLSTKNVIKPTSYCILSYIKNTFNANLIQNRKDIFNQRITKISKYIDILVFLSNTAIYSKIKHTAYFTTYFDSLLLLFYINSPLFRFEVLNAMNVFTLYDDCKISFSEKKNEKVQLKLISHIEELFGELENSNKIAEDLTLQKNELLQKMETAKEIFKNKITENSDLMESFFVNTKLNFNIAANEFGILISIFVNLMINNHFEKKIDILCHHNINEIFSFTAKAQSISNDTDKENQKINITQEIGKFFKYHNFFLNLKTLKQELNKPLQSDNTMKLSRFTFQIPLAILMNNPTSQIIISGEKDDLGSAFSEMKGDLFNLNAFIELLQQNKTDYDLCHKIIFTITRFFCKESETKALFENIKSLIGEIKLILALPDIPLFLSRECFRLFCTLSIRIENCYLWLKFDSSKLTLDTANSNDVVLKYMDDNLNWSLKSNPTILTVKGDDSLSSTPNFQAYNQNITHHNYNAKIDPAVEGRVIRLPYLKVEPYNKTMGIITYSKHYFLLPRPLILSSEIDSSFTLWFRFYNPVINTTKWHTLLQDRNGLISLIAIDSTGSRLGSFVNNGDFVDSGINLMDDELKNRWLQVAVVFKSIGVKEESKVIGELRWYLNGVPINHRLKVYTMNNGNKESYYTNKYILPDNIQYIGNSRDYSEPFGAFCDVRIYKAFKDDEEIMSLYRNDEQKIKNEIGDYDIQKLLFKEIGETAVQFAMNTTFLSEEVLLFFVRFINNLMTNIDFRQRFVNFALVMKLCGEGFEYDKIEVKKELTKYLQIIS